MRDPLDDLVGAYRAVSDRSTGSPQQTRQRLLRAVHQRHRRQRFAIAAAIVGALLLTNATTWAWSTGWVDVVLGGETSPEHAIGNTGAEIAEPEIAEPEIAEPEIAEPEITQPEIAGAANTGVEMQAIDSAPGTTVLVSPLDESGQEATVASPGIAERGGNQASPRSTRTSADVATAPAVDEGTDDALSNALAELEPQLDAAEREAFQAAHDRHFEGDYGSALGRWNRYLQRYPHGRFAPEARYNRAIALLHLRRTDEARTALRTLSDSNLGGRSGTGRREDAQRLLRAMDEGRLNLSGATP